MKFMGHVVLKKDKRNPYKILVGEPQGKRQLGSLRCWWWV